MARPTDYTEDVAVAICTQLAIGRSLKSICADEGSPALSTVYLWLLKHPTFSDLYARAREDQADTMADEIVDISDGTKFAEDTAVLTARDRLRVDARKWVAAKLKPRKYGDRQSLEHSGPNGAPIQTQSEVQVRPQITREEWLAQYVDSAARPAVSGD